MKSEVIKKMIRNNPQFLLDRIGIYPDVSKQQSMVLCPLHDDTNPSLSINIQKCAWYCFAGCGGGSLISLYAAVRKLDIKAQYSKILDEIAGLYSGGNNE